MHEAVVNLVEARLSKARCLKGQACEVRIRAIPSGLVFTTQRSNLLHVVGILTFCTIYGDELRFRLAFPSHIG